MKKAGFKVPGNLRLQYDFDAFSFLLIEKFVTGRGFIQRHAMSNYKRGVDAIVLNLVQEYFRVFVDVSLAHL